MAVNAYDAVVAPSHQNPNANGLKPAVLLNSRENVTGYPAQSAITTSNDKGQLTGDYTVASGKPFTKLVLDHETSNVMHEGPGAGFGPFKTTCKMFVRGETKDIMGFAAQAQYDELVVIVTESDGTRKPIGNVDFPARITAKFDSKSTTASDPRGWEFEISSYSLYPEVLDAASVVPLT